MGTGEVKKAEKAVLMEITKDGLESGLRGVPVGFCTTSSVEPKAGLFYVGQPLSELALREPEGVIHLLFEKHWPSADEAAAFAKTLKAQQQVDPAVFATLRALPRTGHPMKWLIHAINALGMVSATGDYRKDAIAL